MAVLHRGNIWNGVYYYGRASALRRETDGIWIGALRFIPCGWHV